MHTKLINKMILDILKMRNVIYDFYLIFFFFSYYYYSIPKLFSDGISFSSLPINIRLSSHFDVKCLMRT